MKKKWKPLGRKEAHALYWKLRKALHSASMVDAHFGEDTEFIKERTRLYRRSWIESPLEVVIERLKELYDL